MKNGCFREKTTVFWKFERFLSPLAVYSLERIFLRLYFEQHKDCRLGLQNTLPQHFLLMEPSILMVTKNFWWGIFTCYGRVKEDWTGETCDLMTTDPQRADSFTIFVAIFSQNALSCSTNRIVGWN